VFLVGFMGSGKTSVGKALARNLGWPFMDLDDLIETQEGRTVAEIFADAGEKEFRRIERVVLTELLRRSAVAHVVALGGGAYAQSDNAELIRQEGVTTLFLDAPTKTLWQRCNDDAKDRPLRQTFEQFSALHHQRRPHYLRATSRIDTSSKSADAIAEELASKLRVGEIPGEEILR
jgi:shikimate kinase